MPFKQWEAALHLATKWHLLTLRRYALESIRVTAEYAGLSSVDRIDFAIRCEVASLLHPAYKELCDRSDSLTWEEGSRLGYARATAICRIREGRLATGQSTLAAIKEAKALEAPFVLEGEAGVDAMKMVTEDTFSETGTSTTLWRGRASAKGKKGKKRKK